MTPADLVNAGFEGVGAAVQTLNVRALLRDRRVTGVHWAPTLFFTAWGGWNLYFYPSLGQWASFGGGVLLALVNAAWLGLLWRFSRVGRPRVYHVGAALQGIADEHAEVLSSRQREALYQASRLLWEDS